MELFLWLIVGHLIGDFVFQSSWMAIEKGKSWEINFYHAAVYTAGVVLAVKIGIGILLPWEMLLLILFSHFAFDPLKARFELIKDIWVDQLLHLTVLAFIAFLAAEPFQIFGASVFLLFVVASSLYMVEYMSGKKRNT